MADSGLFNQTPDENFRSFETDVIHKGFNPEDFPELGNPVSLPISLSSTFKHSVTNPSRHLYSRLGNTTRDGLENALAVLEDGKYSLVFSSGLAAVNAMLDCLQAGDHLLCMNDVYSGTMLSMQTLARRHGVSSEMVDMTVLENVERALNPRTKLIWIESPTNPTMRVVDIKAVVAMVKSYNKDVVVVVDNTFATPYFQRPLQLGADVTMESLTKYINGHSDVCMGSLTTNDKALHDKIRYVQMIGGAVPSPFDCYLVWRGAKTLSLRMVKHMTNGLAVARFLESHEMVEKVEHPGLESHKQYEIAKRQMRGYSGIFSFYMKGGLVAVLSFLRSLKIITYAASLGGFESLIEHPASMTHAHVPTERRADLGIHDGFLRISIGLEDENDLLGDLKSALKAAEEAVKHGAKLEDFPPVECHQAILFLDKEPF